MKNERMEFLEKFYNDLLKKDAEKVLEAAILFHLDPSYKNWLGVHHLLTGCRESMVVRDSFKAHNS